MSHDRGCPCGRERYEYDSCPTLVCDRRDVYWSIAVKFFATETPGLLRRSVNGIEDLGTFNDEGDFVPQAPKVDRYRFTIYTRKTTYFIEPEEEILNVKHYVAHICEHGVWISETNFITSNGIEHIGVQKLA